MRIGVVGLGFMGSTHLQGLAKVSQAQVVAVADRNQARLNGDLSDIEGNLGIQGLKMDFSGYRKYTEFEDMLADTEVDGVDICVPTFLHASMAMKALAAGKHVLLEKPMALDGASCDELVAAAQQSGRIFMVAQVLRFLPQYQVLVELVKSGRLGRVRSAIFRRRTAVPTWGAWEFDRDKSGGGVFDLLVHDVDMALLLFGVPAALSSTGYENLAGGVDMVTSEFSYENADSVTITGGWHHRGAYPFSMEYTVVADEGVVEYSSAGRPPAIYWKDGRKEELPAPEVDGYQAEIEYFVKCASAGVQPERCLPAESAAAVKVAKLMVDAREKRGERIACQC